MSHVGPVVLGLDVGGSSVKHLLAPALASMDAPPTPLARGRHSTPKAAPVEGLSAIVDSLRGDADLERVVLSIPGLVDEAEGVVVRSTNIPSLDGRPLGAQLSGALGVPVDVINDGHAAAVAEASWGAGAGIDDVFVLALGTGIAGAHVAHGRVVPGAHGSAGELGHITIEPDGHLCSCGRRGCLETIIGAPALRRAWAKAGVREVRRSCSRPATPGMPRPRRSSSAHRRRSPRRSSPSAPSWTRGASSSAADSPRRRTSS
ncbi:ROK family protein [Microbacterium sp. Se5.02b]|uniref:ROK family protein n=1 Tax=Microbacterium sp. Se5.02b TaxID=2864103 RepID=UPI001C68A24B|nr:ROK family protein [Microbacterium sp. Se5.02b]QYM64688.1 ROK family protein [Microbacterium sp. Se5.02b]